MGKGYHVEVPFRIPASARDLEGFRQWARSDRFPDYGRIDYLGGLSPAGAGPPAKGAYPARPLDLPHGGRCFMRWVDLLKEGPISFRQELSCRP